MFLLGLAIGGFIGGTVVHLIREVSDAEIGCMPEDMPYDWAEES